MATGCISLASTAFRDLQPSSMQGWNKGRHTLDSYKCVPHTRLFTLRLRESELQKRSPDGEGDRVHKSTSTRRVTVISKRANSSSLAVLAPPPSPHHPQNPGTRRKHQLPGPWAPAAGAQEHLSSTIYTCGLGTKVRNARHHAEQEQGRERQQRAV